MIIVRMLAKFV